MLTDPETRNFFNYFVSHYAHRSNQWAACYRADAKINTNMSVERWHKELKYNSDLNGKSGGRLDLAIHSLMKSLKLRLMDRLASLTKGKRTKKVTLLRKAHKLAKKKFMKSKFLMKILVLGLCLLLPKKIKLIT